MSSNKLINRTQEKWTDDEFNHPFLPELRHFLKISREYQTLYANCEGSYNRRIIKLNETHKLMDFVTCTIFYNETEHDMVEFEDSELIQAKMIVEKIVSKSVENVPDEIHFSAVWIYYFDYSKKSTEAVPLFKVFVNKSLDKAVYFDVDGNLFNDWDNYLANANLPLSFLCVPYNGTYSVDTSNFVNLEYLCFNKDLVYHNRQVFKPFCLRILDFLFIPTFSNGSNSLFWTPQKFLGILRKHISACPSILLVVKLAYHIKKKDVLRGFCKPMLESFQKTVFMLFKEHDIFPHSKNLNLLIVNTILNMKFSEFFTVEEGSLILNDFVSQLQSFLSQFSYSEKNASMIFINLIYLMCSSESLVNMIKKFVPTNPIILAFNFFIFLSKIFKNIMENLSQDQNLIITNGLSCSH